MATSTNTLLSPKSMVTAGDWLGEAMGLAEGTKLGLDEGDTVGETVGLALGGLVGDPDGLEVN